MPWPALIEARPVSMMTTVDSLKDMVTVLLLFWPGSDGYLVFLGCLAPTMLAIRRCPRHAAQWSALSRSTYNISSRRNLATSAEEYDIVVIGGGPAGLALAAGLGMLGQSHSGYD
jgi:hypothetical protein